MTFRKLALATLISLAPATVALAQSSVPQPPAAHQAHDHTPRIHDRAPRPHGPSTSNRS